MYCVSSSVGGGGWDDSPFLSMMQSRQGLYMEEKHGELAFYLTLEILSNQLPHKGAKSLQREIAKRLTHKELHSQKILVERRVENQRTNQTKRIVKSGDDPTKLKSKGDGQLKR